MDVRCGAPEKVAPVMTVFDSGGLEVPVERVEAALRDETLLVAVRDGRVLGALLLDPALDAGPTAIEAIAVRPRRRAQGIGSTLVRSAAARHGSLVATFDRRVRPFWKSLGFEIRPMDGEDRYSARAETGSLQG